MKGEISEKYPVSVPHALVGQSVKVVAARLRGGESLSRLASLALPRGYRVEKQQSKSYRARAFSSLMKWSFVGWARSAHAAADDKRKVAIR
ncbi:hypothetical protein D3870_18310 [Noviherbaspirillum cavernae]|uniref:Uncharacterized protein n=1 Tax=Noviherbaspirillum cavernae TaxID=2320862 RepID=A0A418X5C5_9BURK|nr:hypothetical protein D3870_18310 [Noviherbaspirillum cavernae]